MALGRLGLVEAVICLPSLLCCSITFEPATADLRATIAQLTGWNGGVAVYDNSVTDSVRIDVRLACDMAGIPYLGDGRNLGTAGALNRLVAHASEQTYDWMFYVDQDSRFSDAYRELLVSAIACVNERAEVAAVGSLIELNADDATASAVYRCRFVERRFLIASGTLFRVQAVCRLGGFDLGMFLDTVDHEFCLRARSLGWSILRDNSRILVHRIGENSRVVNKWSQLRIARHPIWRRELMWRNTVVLVRRYWRAFPMDCLRHLCARLAETLLAAIAYKDFASVTAAVHGVRSGWREDPRRGTT